MALAKLKQIVNSKIFIASVYINFPIDEGKVHSLLEGRDGKCIYETALTKST